MMSLAAMAGMERHLRTTFPIWLGLVVTPATPWSSPQPTGSASTEAFARIAHRLHTLPPLPPGRQFADRNDQVHPADAGNRRPTTSGSRSLSVRADRPVAGLGGPPPAGESRRATATPIVEVARSLASRFWAKAEELSNTPWKLVADRLHANLAICQDAYRLRKLPPSILPEQAESFAA